MALAAMGIKRLLRRYWMPIAFFIMGAFSVALLSWSVISHSSQRQDFAMMNAIMDMQIHTATAHLWFEEALYGDPSVDLDSVWGDFDRGIRWSTLILEGGDTGNGLVLEPMEESSLRKDAEN